MSPKKRPKQGGGGLTNWLLKVPPVPTDAEPIANAETQPDEARPVLPGSEAVQAGESPEVQPGGSQEPKECVTEPDDSGDDADAAAGPEAASVVPELEEGPGPPPAATVDAIVPPEVSEATAAKNANAKPLPEPSQELFGDMTSPDCEDSQYDDFMEDAQPQPCSESDDDDVLADMYDIMDSDADKDSGGTEP